MKILNYIVNEIKNLYPNKKVQLLDYEINELSSMIKYRQKNVHKTYIDIETLKEIIKNTKNVDELKILHSKQKEFESTIVFRKTVLKQDKEKIILLEQIRNRETKIK